jgi:hypothetical protein
MDDTQKTEGTMPTDLIRLSKQFTGKFIKERKMGGGRTESYVPHSSVSERLLQVVGPYDWDFDIIKSEDVPVAVKGQLTVTLDGKEVTVSGAGTPQNTGESVGEQIKKMESDAFKRAASKVGVALHLWSQENYFLDVVLSKEHGVVLTELS